MCFTAVIAFFQASWSSWSYRECERELQEDFSIAQSVAGILDNFVHSSAFSCQLHFPNFY